MFNLMNMTQLSDLLNKSLQLVERTHNQESISNIDKDILLSNIRKLYDIVLELPTQKANKVIETTVPDVTLPQDPVVESAPTITAEAENIPDFQPKYIPHDPVPFEIESSEVVSTHVDALKIPEPQVIETIVKEDPIKNEPIEPVVEVVVPVVEDVVKNPKPSFDDLVDKVKEQFNQPSKPQPTVSVTDDDDDELPVFFSDLKFDKLFDSEYARELSEKLSASKVDDIGRSMGLNEKIFTVNALFGGDSSAFDKTINKLQACNTFDEAKMYITEEIAPKYDWLSAEKFKKAKEFIKLVKRKFA